MLILLAFLVILLFYRVALAHKIRPDAVETVLPFDRRKSARLMMSVPVLIYGWDPENAPFIEITDTLCVSSHGGLVALNQAVEVGQTVLVANMESQSSNEQQCRVIHVGRPDHGKRPVGFALAEPESGFWGLEYDSRQGYWHTAEPERQL